MKLILILILLFSLNSFGAEFHDVKMADDIVVAGQKLKLKGMGLRELSVLGIIIRVYVGGLYVANPSDDCDKIISSDQTRSVYMSFIHHIPRSELAESLETGVSKNCGDKCAEMKTKAQEIKPLVPTMGSGDVLKITFDSKGTDFQLNDKALGRVEGAAFSKVLLSAFIGKNPPTAALKNGLCLNQH